MLEDHTPLCGWGTGVVGDFSQAVTERGVGEVILEEEVAGERVRKVMEGRWVQGAATMQVGFRAHEGGVLLQAGAPTGVHVGEG